MRLPSVVAHTVRHDELPGRLAAKRFDEEPIPAEDRLPRLTSATWKYEGGAVGTLTHVIALHGAALDISTAMDTYTLLYWQGRRTTQSWTCMLTDITSSSSTHTLPRNCTSGGLVRPK